MWDIIPEHLHTRNSLFLKLYVLEIDMYITCVDWISITNTTVEKLKYNLLQTCKDERGEFFPFQSHRSTAIERIGHSTTNELIELIYGNFYL